MIGSGALNTGNVGTSSFFSALTNSLLRICRAFGGGGGSSSTSIASPAQADRKSIGGELDGEGNAAGQNGSKQWHGVQGRSRGQPCTIPVDLD
eukprot:5153556-Pyramimonas_sp.AAC.1